MICIIPARGDSQRIPKKNLKDFHGKPIIQYSIDTAKESGLFDGIYVSTDNQETIAIAQSSGVNYYHRSSELSTNDVGTQEVVRDVIENLEILSDEIVCCIYATSPLLAVEDLMRGCSALKINRSMMFSFSIGLNPLRDAGNFYFGRSQGFKTNWPVHAEHSIMIPIPEERCIDINTPEDWSLAEKMYGKLHDML